MQEILDKFSDLFNKAENLDDPNQDLAIFLTSKRSGIRHRDDYDSKGMIDPNSLEFLAPRPMNESNPSLSPDEPPLTSTINPSDSTSVISEYSHPYSSAVTDYGKWYTRHAFHSSFSDALWITHD